LYSLWGGSAVAYQPLANEIPENWSLYAVQIPGRDFSRPHEKPESLEKVAEMCISEIKEKVTGLLFCMDNVLGSFGYQTGIYDGRAGNGAGWCN